ncbi:MAG: DNA primase noncatalytic subunit PriX [Candidatus Nitrosopolaris wilkensis]|nr:MAG: DNA primase noncatalytic subunit PriX [Candidatus Nitrosopolaris wilkensis]
MDILANEKRGPDSVPSIEQLLETPIENYRKNAISLILAPYFVNIKKYSYEQAYAAIKEWLNKCNTVKRFGCNSDSRIKYGLEVAMKAGIRPLKAETLKLKNVQLYKTLTLKH